MNITKEQIEFEKIRMQFEKLHFGRFLLVGTGESESFWNAKRYEAGNRWWKFWERKSDYQLIKDEYLQAKENGDKWGVPPDLERNLKSQNQTKDDISKKTHLLY